MRTAVLVACVAGALAACGGGPGPAPGGGPASATACAPVSGLLPAGATLEDAPGAYRLTMVRADGGETAEGALTLSRRPAPLQQVEGWTAPLAGALSMDLSALGAQTFGPVDGEDPEAPGVLVLESAGPPPTILLRLGSSANRADRRAFDESFTALSVRAIDGDGFAGSWRSAYGTTEVSGHFCALRSG